MKRVLLFVVALGFFVLCVMFGFGQIGAPALPKGFEEKMVLAQAASPNAPDLNVMMTHIKTVATQNHEAGSARQKMIKNYLLDEIAAMGYTPEVEDFHLSLDEIYDIVVSQRHNANYEISVDSIAEYGNMPKEGVDLANILVKADAPGTDKGVLFVAHYDSVKFGPGASDDMISVSALLESMRMLRYKEGTLKNDVYFLLTDGEEQGLLGARRFVTQHPEYKDKIAQVYNIEARGCQGAVLLFETSDQNLGMVQNYGQAVSRPVGFSIATTVYRMMQNNTDLSEFLDNKYPGINLSMIEGAQVYHTDQDTVENMSRQSALHYLNTTWELVQNAAQVDLGTLNSNTDAVFFPFFAGNMIVFSQSVGYVILGFALVLMLAVFVVAFVKKRTTFKRVLGSAGLMLACMAVCGALVYGVVSLLLGANGFEPSITVKPILGWKWTPVIFMSSLIFTGIIVTLANLWFGKKTKDPLALMLGVMPLFALLGIGAAVAFPSASYLFALTLICLGASCAANLWAHKMQKLSGALRILAMAVTGLVTVLTFVPVVFLLNVAMTLPVAFVACALAVLPLMAYMSTMVSALQPPKTV